MSLARKDIGNSNSKTAQRDSAIAKRASRIPTENPASSANQNTSPETSSAVIAKTKQTTRRLPRLHEYRSAHDGEMRYALRKTVNQLGCAGAARVCEEGRSKDND